MGIADDRPDERALTGLPQTRWAFELHWAGVAATPETSRAGSGDARSSRHAAAVPTASISLPAATQHALLLLVERELRRGYRHVALRHFLMLRASGASVPPALEARCSELLAVFPGKKEAVLLGRLQAWVEMLHPHATSASRAGRAC